MKCNQKLCQRTKTLNSQGICNVCDDVIKENDKKHAKIDKNVYQWVEMDLNHMLAAHKKLEKGEQVDHQVLSQLLLGGVINILAQHDTIAKNEEKVVILEHANVTNQTRIEALENWVLRQSDQIKELENNLVRIDNNGVIENEKVEIVEIKKKIVSLATDLCNVRNRSRIMNVIKPTAEPENQKILKTTIKQYCKECKHSFTRTCDLEKHMVSEHASKKQHKCPECDKTFLLKWRMMKHMKIHNEPTKTCKYFNDAIECPFEELGCKFVHDIDNQRNMEGGDQKNSDAGDRESESVSDDNFCYFCENDFEDAKNLEDHIKSEHMDRFQVN